MKSSALAAAFIAAISALATPFAAADMCESMVRGQECTNAQGQKSRCSRFRQCISNVESCPTSSKLLQACHSFRTLYCYPLFDGEPLKCLDVAQIDTIVQRDVCINKSDGTACKSAYTDLNGKAGLTATVYEEDGVCEEFYCLSMIHTSCNDKPLFSACTYDGVANGNIVRFEGKCMSNAPYRNRCEKSGSGTILRSAKVLVANAPIATTSAPSTTTPSKTPSPSKTSSSSSNKTLNSILDDVLSGVRLARHSHMDVVWFGHSD